MKEKYSKLGILTVELWREQAISLTDAVHNTKIGSLHSVPEKALKGQALDVATTCVLHGIPLHQTNDCL